MTTAEILLKAADLIEPEGAWTTEAYARNDGGDIVQPGDPSASCWCLIGAIGRVDRFNPSYMALDKFEAMPAIQALTAVTDGVWPPNWQDSIGRTQAEVVAALRAAAKTVGAES